MKTDPIVDQVIAKFQQRSSVGITKYGTTLYENNHDNFFIHLQEELMDSLLYLQKLIKQRSELIDLITETTDDATLGAKIRSLVR